MSAAPPAATSTATPAGTAAVTPATASTVASPVRTIRPPHVTDQQTGKVFQVVPECWYDKVAAAISAVYSLAVIGYLTFMVVSILSGKYAFWPKTLTNNIANLLTYPVAKLILYTAIGGAMGAAVNNLRSFISWHAEEKAFGWRFVWKYLSMPPLGGTLAVLVYGILQGGITVINGGATPENNQLTSLSAWATGTLAGYGSSKVFIWLDDKVNTLFKIDKKQAAVPDVTGKSLDEAKQIVSSAQLAIGNVSEQATSGNQVGKVIAQTPGVGTQIDCGSKVDVTVGVAESGGDQDPTIAPEVTGAVKNGNGASSNGTRSNGTGAVETIVNETTADEKATTDTTESAGTSAGETTASETETAETTGVTETTPDETVGQPAGEEKG